MRIRRDRRGTSRRATTRAPRSRRKGHPVTHPTIDPATDAGTPTAGTDPAAEGAARIAWIRSRMPLLAGLRDELATTRPFAGRTIGVSLHLEPKTAVLVETLAAGGARIVGTGNHGSTQDDVVAALQASGVELFGRRDDTLDDHRANLERTLAERPDMLLDNGADLALGTVAHGFADEVVGGTEETTSGGFRLREQGVAVPFPVIVINDSRIKAIGENRHAVGQSAVESLMRITNLQVPGSRFLVIGYGWCGRGVAQYLAALGGKVGVVERDPVTALEAAFDGHRVGALEELLPWAEVVVTATGRPGALPASALEHVADGAVLANIGHFPWEIDVDALRAGARTAQVAPAIERIERGGKHAILLAEGRMFNLAGPNPKGNSIQSMDLGFLLQARSLERVAAGGLEPGPQGVPVEIEHGIARAMLAAMGAAR